MNQAAARDEASAEAVPFDADSALRHHVANVVMAHATRNHSLASPKAIAEICRVTGRANSTVKAWFHFRTTYPDFPALARIIAHWNIPREQILPDELSALLSGGQDPTSEATWRPIGEVATYSFYSPNDAPMLDRALSVYTANPRNTLFVRHDSSDMLDQIRPGELMMVDPSCEQISGAGIYMLRFSMPDQPTRNFVRNVEPLMSEAAVRVSSGGTLSASAEVIPLVQGQLPAHVSVLFRVIAVLRQT